MTLAPANSGFNTIAIDLRMPDADPQQTLVAALRRSPRKIIFIGNPGGLAQVAYESGYEVEILPMGACVPTEAVLFCMERQTVNGSIPTPAQPAGNPMSSPIIECNFDTVAIDVDTHRQTLPQAIGIALRRNPNKMIFIGDPGKLAQLARESGHDVDILPSGTPVPAGAFEIVAPQPTAA